MPKGPIENGRGTVFRIVRECTGLFTSKHFILVICSFFVAVLSTVIILYAFSASPIADDWTFFQDHRNSSLLEFIDKSMQHTGRASQWAVIWVGYELFGMKAVKIMPLLLFILLSLGMGLLMRRVIRSKTPEQGLIAMLLGCFIAGVSVMCMPSINDSFLWYDAAASYIVSLIFLVFGCYAIYSAIAARTKKGLIGLSIMVTLLIVGQLANEPTSIWMIGASLIGLVVSLIKRNRKSIRIFCISSAALIAGFAILFFSPGSISRRTESAKIDLVDALLMSFGGYERMFSDWMMWLILIPPLMPLTTILIGEIRHQIRPGIAALLAIAVFLTTTYPVFLANHIAQGGYFPWRVLTLPTFGTVIAVVFFSIAMRGVLGSHFDNARGFVGVVAGGLVALSSVAVIAISSNNLQKLTMREQIVNMRDAKLSKQVDSGATVYEIMRAPLLLRGDADDFYYNNGRYDKNGRVWVLNHYLVYMGIDDNIPSDRVILVDPPSWYR